VVIARSDFLSIVATKRQICEIVWVVASEPFYHMSNIALNVHIGYVLLYREEPTEPAQDATNALI